MRWQSVSVAVVATAFSIQLLSPTPAAAENVFKRAGSAIGGFFKRVGRVFRREPLDANLVLALDSYEKGDYFTTYLYAARVQAGGNPRLTDDAELLMGLSAADGGLRHASVSRLRGLLEDDAVSPYYPLALATLLDLELRLGDNDAAAEMAARYLADLWEHPTSPREADVKAVFLEYGNISSIVHPTYEKLSHTDRDVRFVERPADRAMYLAGSALLGAREFEKAALCLEVIEPKSPFFPYARYALGQTYYGLGRLDDALEMLSQVQAQPGKGRIETFLRDRALLIGAQLLHEADQNSAAVNWVRHVSRRGPFGLHAAMLAAQIQADDKQPSLAVVYLDDRPEKSVEPKLAARAAAFDAKLHRDMSDIDTAVARLEQGLKGLEAYSVRLRSVAERGSEADRLLAPLAERQEGRERIAEWRRQNVASAVPDLVDGRAAPNWAARMLTRAIVDPKSGGYPIIYYRSPYDPFTALKPPKDIPFEPPADGAFPTVFRHSQAQALNDSLHQELALESALASGDDTQLALMLIADALELRANLASDDAKVELGDLVELIGLPDESAARLAARDAGRDSLGAALATMDPLGADAGRHERLLAIGRGQLELWKDYRRKLLAAAVVTEQQAVDEIRFQLEFELSQTLAEKRMRDNKVLEGS